MHAVSLLDDERWEWGAVARAREPFRGRDGVRLSGEPALITLKEVELVDGVVELDVAVTRERSFHGLSWRVRDEENCEAFWVRPHQVGNPDSIQYSPITNGLDAWQLFHGAGFWHSVEFPIDDWFTIRIAFAGDRLQAHVHDLDEPALPCTRLRRVPTAGAVAIRFGGGDLRVGELRYTDDAPILPSLPDEPVLPGAVTRWQVSAAFPEAELEAQLGLERRWTTVEPEPSGLLDLARVNGVRSKANTVLVRTTVESERARRAALALGFSDRALVFLNGEPLYRGSDGYRSRDYRFLGSIGWYDTVYLPLTAGANELVIAVSEDFGGWGIQARLDAGSRG